MTDFEMKKQQVLGNLTFNWSIALQGYVESKAADGPINADIDSILDINFLISEGITGTIEFRMYDNTVKTIAKAKLIQMLNEIKEHRFAMHAKKWAYYDQIMAATTIAELDAIIFDFPGLIYQDPNEPRTLSFEELQCRSKYIPKLSKAISI